MNHIWGLAMAAACSRNGRRLGRRSKGDRRFVATRVPAQTITSIKAIAEDTSTPLGDVVGTLLLLGVRHSAELDAAMDELMPLTRTTGDGQVQFNPSNTKDSIVNLIGRAPTPVVERIEELRDGISPDGKIPMLLVFSALLAIGLRGVENTTFDSALSDMYALALDPSLATTMLGKQVATTRNREEQGVLSLAI
ncbi:hypothetical protein [Rhodococcus pyridinivorans]|uniref:hypothetical protein n=1 Tax=Rhodococcus pyridinivorans TaxID=103816 RepID=UPI003AAF7CF8